MTQKTYQMTPGGMKKMPGWFSWRHQTRNAHDAATAAYKARHGKLARQRRAQERAAVWATLSDGERRQVMAANHEAARR